MNKHQNKKSPAKEFIAPHEVAQDREMTQQEAADAIGLLAATITDDFTFIAVLRDADPNLRQQVYDEILPHLHPGYCPRPFALMSFDEN